MPLNEYRAVLGYQEILIENYKLSCKLVKQAKNLELGFLPTFWHTDCNNFSEVRLKNPSRMTCLECLLKYQTSVIQSLLNNPDRRFSVFPRSWFLSSLFVLLSFNGRKFCDFYFKQLPVFFYKVFTSCYVTKFVEEIAMFSVTRYKCKPYPPSPNF